MNNKWGKLTFTKGNKVKLRFVFAITLLLTFFLLFILNRDLFHLILEGDIDTIRADFADNSLKAYLIMLVIMVIQNSFTIIPLILVITINITLFGVVYGFLWSWLTSIVAAILVFMSVRYLFKDRLLNRFRSENITNIEKQGFTYVFHARIFPFVPTSLINILAGVTAIRFRHFLYGTMLGNFLFFIVLSLIPAGILSINLNEYEIGMILFLSITLFLGIRRVFRNKKRSKQPIEEDHNPTEKEDVLLEEKRKSN
ncbi:TVP38/TMEM64 family protein [Mesobacillus maritimus]|uniref:TVP38/TMEM64 family protein n=1 Tax=Mesobacillus maritimus TaxID=1643336 RepID=UPI00384CBB23